MTLAQPRHRSAFGDGWFIRLKCQLALLRTTGHDGTVADWRKEQRALIAAALDNATEEVILATLDGTIGDAQAFCWAALAQYERRGDFLENQTRRDFGLHHAEKHTFLLLGHEAVDHAKRVSQLLDFLEVPSELPPDKGTRSRLAEARNLLAEHRDERVFYWRLTGKHTPHVEDVYRRLGTDLPTGSVDTEQYNELGYRWGSIGGLLSLPELHRQLADLEGRLDELAHRYVPGYSSP